MPANVCTYIHAHVSARFPAEKVRFLLENKADVVLVTNDGKSALDVATSEVRELLEAAKPRPACTIKDCYDMCAEHVAEFAHPDRERMLARADRATEQWGEAGWEVNVFGDAQQEHGWHPVSVTSTPTRHSSTDRVRITQLGFCAALFHFEHENGPKHAQLPVIDPISKSGSISGEVDWSTLTVKVESKNARGMVVKDVRLPLRRMLSDGSKTHPIGDMHPWDRVTIERKESITQDFLTNEFFFKCFCKAVQQSGGTVDFSADEMFDFRHNQSWQDLTRNQATLERRGGVLYRTAAGWKRFALRVAGK